MSGDDDFSDGFDSLPSKDEVKDTLSEITARCDAAEIAYEDNSTFDDELDIGVTIQIPCGRETRSVYLFDFDELKAFQSILV